MTDIERAREILVAEFAAAGWETSAALLADPNCPPDARTTIALRAITKALSEGRAIERQAIVEWLRKKAEAHERARQFTAASSAWRYHNLIEDGDHIPTIEGGGN